MKLFNPANIITLTGLLPVLFGFYFINTHQPLKAIGAMGIALLLDILDGYVARKLNVTSNLGRNLDSFLDAFNYLILTSYFLYTFFDFNGWLKLFLIFCILAGGILRLSRHNVTGLTKQQNQLYYTGLIVPYIQLTIILFFLFSAYVTPRLSPLLIIIIPLLSRLMIANFKMKKL